MGIEKNNKISIYLKKTKVSPKEFLRKESDYKKIDLGDEIFFYYEESKKNKPPWLKNFFNGKLDINFFNQSSKGVCVVKSTIESKEIYFAIPFGYGHTMIERDNCVDDFGLKTVLNLVDENSIRRVRKKTLSSDLKNTDEQLSKIGNISNFGIDIEQDLIEEITGKPKASSFVNNTVTGKLAFTVSAKVNIDKVKEFLKKCFEYYNKKDYRENFAFIDQVKEIKDIKEWNEKLVAKLKDDSLPDVSVWMAIPEIIEWEDVAGFSYSNKKEELVDDITIEGLKKSLTDCQKNNLNFDFLKKKKVHCFRSSSDQEYKDWSYFKCLYCEITKDGKQILLTNGKWYEVKQDFVDEVNKSYTEILGKSLCRTFIECEEQESEYNEKLAESIDGILMDKKNIKFAGHPNQVEFCDVYDTKYKAFIHIKKYRGSSVLSHLFSQGLVSGELFLSAPEFRKAVIEKEPLLSKYLVDSDPMARDYKIIFGIIHKSSKEKFDLPFFSKVNLRNVVRRLKTFGFDVYLIKIQQK